MLCWFSIDILVYYKFWYISSVQGETLFIIDITVDTERPRQPAEEAAAHAKHQRPFAEGHVLVVPVMYHEADPWIYKYMMYYS